MHPIFVHFPIALLIVYSLFEVARLPILKRQTWWFPVKAVLLFLGWIGGFMALQTGEIAAEAYEATNTYSLVELHETFALTTMWIYGVLVFSYVIRSGTLGGLPLRIPPTLRSSWATLERVEHVIFSSPVLILLAVLGFTAMGIVGALGGAIVYGPHADPIVSLVYSFFFPK